MSICLVLSISECAPVEVSSNTDWHKFNLRGRVKTIEEVSYYVDIKDGMIQKGEREENSFSKQITFNEKGQVLIYNTYEKDGSLYLQNDYQYSDDEILRKIKKFKKNNRYMGKDTMIYNDKNLLIERVSYSSKDSLNNKEVFEYNSDDKVSKFQLFSYKGELLTTINYEYDEKNNKKEVTEYYPDGRLNRKRFYRYDDLGNEIGSSWINADNTFFAKWEYKYDNYKNQVEKLTLNEADKVVVKREYHYEYDKHHNWVKQIKYENGKPKLITELNIIYF